jgi:hypothetical protein
VYILRVNRTNGPIGLRQAMKDIDTNPNITSQLLLKLVHNFSEPIFFYHSLSFTRLTSRIGHAWGCAKNNYRRQPLKHKKGKENFWQTVRKCFSRQVVTTQKVRLFSQRARAYILAYHKIRQEERSNSPQQQPIWTELPLQ